MTSCSFYDPQQRIEDQINTFWNPLGSHFVSSLRESIHEHLHVVLTRKYIYVENCVTYIHRTIWKWHSIWIYIFWHFGHIYYHLDTNITIWIYEDMFDHRSYTLNLSSWETYLHIILRSSNIWTFIYSLVIWIYILQFGHIYCNLDINMETRHMYQTFQHIDPVWQAYPGPRTPSVDPVHGPGPSKHGPGPFMDPPIFPTPKNTIGINKKIKEVQWKNNFKW